MIKNILNFVWQYLKDWKNLLAHALIGVLILAVGFYLPVKPAYRITLMVIIIILNTLRMRRAEQAQLEEKTQA